MSNVRQHKMPTPSSVAPGYAAVVDPEAESASSDLPEFIAVPADAPAYYGFPLLQGSELEGWAFGVITSPVGDEPRVWGDAYVVAPDGSRAGIVWRAAGDPEPGIVCPASEGCWGVYGLSFRQL